MAQYQFRNREEAGHILSAHLVHYAGRSDVQVLALPRGGVPVGYQIALALMVRLDVLVLGRVGVPGREEITLAVVGPDGMAIPNWEVAKAFGIPQPTLEAMGAEEAKELARRNRRFRGDRPPIDIRGQTVILVDDGLPSAALLRNAATVLRRRHPARVVVAVPVAAHTAYRHLADEVDEIVVSQRPERLSLLSQYYEEFGLVSDEKIRQFLEASEHERQVA